MKRKEQPKPRREAAVNLKSRGLTRFGAMSLIRDERGRWFLRVDVRLYPMGSAVVPINVKEEEAEPLQEALQEAAEEICEADRAEED